MTVGFTGTQRGMSFSQELQCRLVLQWLWRAGGTVFVDGDCPRHSADQEAREIADELGYECQQEPPANRTAKALLARNRRIVARCDVLVAAPRTNEEELRSGTWMTVRAAHKAGKPVVMLSR